MVQPRWHYFVICIMIRSLYHRDHASVTPNVYPVKNLITVTLLISESTSLRGPHLLIFSLVMLSSQIRVVRNNMFLPERARMYSAHPRNFHNNYWPAKRRRQFLAGFCVGWSLYRSPVWLCGLRRLQSFLQGYYVFLELIFCRRDLSMDR